MSDRKTIADHSFDILAVICTCGLWFFCHDEFTLRLNDLFLDVFGKNLSGRNLPVRIAVTGGIFLLSLLLPILFERLVCRNGKLRRLADAVILAFLAVPVIRMLVICANQTIRRDDYWEIADARAYGFPGSMFFEMKRYNGRYLSWCLRSLHAVFDPIAYIDIMLFVDLVIFTIGASLLVRQVLKCQSQNRKNAGQGLLTICTGFAIVAACILMATNAWEFWFWSSGTVVYGIGLSLCILSAAMVLQTAFEPSSRPAKLIFTAVLCFLGCGCSEICTASLAAFLLIILIWKRCTASVWDKRLIFFFAEVCACTLGILFLSGSVGYAGEHANLEEQAPVITGLWNRLPMIIGWALHSLWDFILVKKGTMLLFLVIFLVLGTQMRFSRQTGKAFPVIALLLFLIAHGILFINTALSYLPPRVVTISICWIILGAALLCFTAGSLLSEHLGGKADPAKLALCAFLICFLINRFYSENIEELRILRNSWATRNSVLLQTEYEGEPVRTCSLPVPGSSSPDITKDFRHDYNIGLALYYDFPAIYAEAPCPPYGESYFFKEK